MADDGGDVLLKVGVDGSGDAVAALELLVEGMGELIKAVKDVGDACLETAVAVMDIGKAAGKTKKPMDDATAAAVAYGAQLNKAFETATNAVKGAVMALPRMVTAAAEAGDEMATLSARIGTSVEDLAELKYIAGQSGASMEGMARTIQSMGGILDESNEKSKKARDAIADLGLSVTDLSKQDPKQAFIEIIKGIQDTVPAAQQGTVAMEIFGSKFRNNTMLLKEDIGALQSKFHELGGGMTSELAKAGDTYSDNLKNIQQVQENFRNQIASAVLPALNNLMETFPQLGGLVATVAGGVFDLAKSLGPMIIQLIAARAAFLQKAAAAQVDAVATGEAAVANEAVAVSSLSAAAAENVATASTSALAVAMDILMGPVGWIIGALTLLGIGWLAFSKSSTEAEKSARANSAAFKEQTDTLDSAMKTYDELHGKLKLTKDETERLEKATRLLAEASGLSEEAFKKDAAAADLAVRKVRELLVGNKELIDALALEAKKKLDAKKAEAAAAGAEVARLEREKSGPEVTRYIMSQIPLIDRQKLSTLELANAVVAQTKAEAELNVEAAKLEREWKILTGQQVDVATSTNAVTDGLEGLGTELIRVRKLVTDLDDAQKSRIKTQIDANTKSKDIAEALINDMKRMGKEGIPTVDDLTRSVDLFKDSLKDAESAAKKLPLTKLAEDAKDLADGLKAAKDAGQPAAVTLEDLGKKSADLVQHARGIENGMKLITPAIQEQADAWNKAQLSEKMEKLDVSTMKLVTTFHDKLTDATRTAAQATEDMATEMTISMMTESDARMARIDLAEKKQSDAIDKQVADNARGLRDQLRDLQAAGDEQLQIAQKGAADRGEVLTLEQVKQISDATAARMDGARKDANAQEGALTILLNQWKKYYANQRGLATGHSEDFEANMKFFGIATKKSADDQLTIEKNKLKELEELAKNDPYYQIQLDNQREVVRGAEAMFNRLEALQHAHGDKTKADLQADLRKQMDHLNELRNNRDKVGDAAIAKQEAIVQAGWDGLNEHTQMAKQWGTKTQEMLDTEVLTAQNRLTEMKSDRNTWGKAAIAAQEAILKNAKKAAGQEGDAYGKMGDTITNAFQSMAALGGDSMKQLSEAMGQATSSMQGMKAAKAEWSAPGATKTDKAGAAVNMGMAGVEGAQAVWKATDTLSTKKNVLGGAMAGAKAGSAFGPWGTAVGAGVGAIVGAFRNKGAMRAAKQAAGDFGAEIPIEVAKAIEKESKKQFKGDRLPAEMLHFGEILEAAGGVTDKNVGKMQARMGDAINLTKQGKLTVEQTTKILDDSFGAFAKHTLESGKIADKGFTDMIKGAEGLGIKSKQIADFVGSQVDRLGNAFAVMISPLAKQAGEIGAQVAEQKQKLDEARKDTEGEDVSEEAQKALDEQSKAYDELIAKQKAMAEDSLPKINRAARLMTATFNEAVASGMSMTEAVDRMGPGLDTLIQATKDLGMTVEDTSAGFLASFRDRVNANRDLVDSAASLNDIMLAMSNIGALNADTFLDLQAQGLETYDQLDKAGFQQNEILSQMKPFLEQARDAHNNLKLPIDENTAALIKQAEEQGILKKQAVDTNMVLMEGFGALIEAVGGKLPEAFKKMKDAALEASQKAAAGMKGVDGAATGVQTSLDSTDWEGWSADAVNAATEAQKAVDGVSLGHSPGGLKEIPIQIEKSLKAFSLFERLGVKSAKNVQKAVENIRPDTAEPGSANTPIEAVAVASAVEESIKASADAMQQMQVATQAMTDDPVMAETMQAMQEAAATMQPMTEAIETMKDVTEPIAQAMEDVKPMLEVSNEVSKEAMIAAKAAADAATQQVVKSDPRTWFGRGGGATQNISLAIDRPILKDRASMQDLAVDVAKHLKRALNPFGAWR